jgi:hypothetical protein
VKHGAVVFFTVLVFVVYWIQRLGGASIEQQLERIYFLTPLYLSLIFSHYWYRSKEIEGRIKNLETALAEREKMPTPSV